MSHDHIAEKDAPRFADRFYREPAAEKGAMAEVAAWVAEALGYPIEVQMPDRPAPQPLWDALVDHIHADESSKWHGNTLDREDVETWLADEAGRAKGPMQ